MKLSDVSPFSLLNGKDDRHFKSVSCVICRATAPFTVGGTMIRTETNILVAIQGRGREKRNRK